MPRTDAAKVKMLQVEQAAALMDKTDDFDASKVAGFFVRALGPGGKTHEFQITPLDAGFNAMLAAFTNLMTKHRAEAQAVLTAVGIQ